MDQFKVVAKTRNGNLLLASDGHKAVGKKLTLYAGGKPAAVLTETIGSVADPRYLAQPLQEVKTGTVLRAKK